MNLRQHQPEGISAESDITEIEVADASWNPVRATPLDRLLDFFAITSVVSRLKLEKILAPSPSGRSLS
jgi:hypothetical protein